MNQQHDVNLLNAGCGTHYAKGWVNTDIWDDGQKTRPDVKVEPGKPYPFPDNHFDAVFLGHVLEHIAWPEVPSFLKEMQRISKPNAEILVCGPDVYKTIQRWAKGQEPWHMVLSTMEHQNMSSVWDGAHHHWNCHHERVWTLLSALGFVSLRDVFDEIPKNTSGTSWKSSTITWPVVGHWHWHFAIHCRNLSK